MEYLGYIIGSGLGGLIVGWLISGALSKNKHQAYDTEARKEAEIVKQRLLDEARAEAAKAKAEAAKEQLKKRKEFDKELKELLEESRNTEKRLEKREELIDRKLQTLERREQEIGRKEQDAAKIEQKRQDQLKEAEAKNQEMTELINEERRKLQTIATITPDQAKALLLHAV